MVKRKFISIIIFICKTWLKANTSDNTTKWNLRLTNLILHIDISEIVQCLGFSYHMYGKTSGMGKLNVYYKAQNGSIFRIFSRIGNLGDAWRREFKQIPPTRGLQVRLSLCKFIPTHPRPRTYNIFLLQIHASYHSFKKCYFYLSVKDYYMPMFCSKYRSPTDYSLFLWKIDRMGHGR